MSDQQLYSKIACYYNNQQLAEESSVTIKRTTGAQQIKTVAKGFAGMSPGSPMIEITVKNAIPAAGFEVTTIGQDMLSLKIVELTFFAGGKTLTTKGFITDDNTTHAVDSPSDIDFTFVGQYADWQ